MNTQRLVFVLTLLSSAWFPGLVWSQNDAKPVWQLQKSGVDASLRGLCVVDAQVVWASGSGGSVIRTEDGGQTWINVSIDGATELDFRDVQAWDANRAVVLSAGQPARVYQTEDGGKNWKQRFEHPNKDSFFDAVSFWDNKHGIAMSDPVDMRILLIETRDGGQTWKELATERRPMKQRGEAGFAASGTNMCVVGNNSIFLALGGAEEGQNEPISRIVFSHDRAKNWSAVNVPMPRNPSSGIFSMAFADANHGIVVGGDYLNPQKTAGNIAVTTDAGKTWTATGGTPPRGYRSCVAVQKSGDTTIWIAVGPTGTDLSTDGGQNWHAASETGFHSVQFSRDGAAGFASGAEGRVAKWIGSTNN